MRRGSWILLAVVLVALPASAQHATGCLEFEILAQGSNSGLDTAPGCEGTCPGLDLVIEDSKTWESVWARNWSNFNPPPPLPEVNFREKIVLTMFLGQRPTTGYSVDVDCISETGLATIGSVPLTVNVIDTSPGTNCIVQPMLTRPFQMVVLDRPRGIWGASRVSVTFEHEDNVVSCGDGDGPLCRICPPDGIGDDGGSQDIIFDPLPCCP